MEAEPLTEEGLNNGNKKKQNEKENLIVPVFGEYIGSGKALRDIYAESCKKYGCKRNSGLYDLLSPRPGDYDCLFEIDLSSNVIGCRGVLSLLQVVTVCKSVKKIGLRGNSLDHKCVLHIIDVAKNHMALQQLDLSHNRIGTCGKAIYELLRLNINITDVCLESTYIDAYMLKRINERLAANRMAKQLREKEGEGKTNLPQPTKPIIVELQQDIAPVQQQQATTTPSAPPASLFKPASTAAPTSVPVSNTTATPPTAYLPCQSLDAQESQPLADGVLPESWWDAAVPIESGESFQPAPQLDGPNEMDWSRFPLSDLFNEAQYSKYIPTATKLLQISAVTDPVKIWSNVPVSHPSMILRESSSHSSSSEGMSILDYSDSSSLNESVVTADDRSIHSSEFSDDELGEAQAPLPALQWSDEEEPETEYMHPIAPLPLTSHNGVATDDVVSLPPQQLEAHLSRSVTRPSLEGSGHASYSALHEKRLAVLNLIFSAVVPKLLKAPIEESFVNRLPPQQQAAAHFRRPRRGSEGLRTESERMDMLFTLVDHASASPFPGVTEAMSRAVLAALEGVAPFALAATSPSPPLPPELVTAVQGFLNTSAHALLSDMPSPIPQENKSRVLVDITCGLVKLSVTRGSVRDILSAVSLLRKLPPDIELPGLQSTFHALSSKLPRMAGLLMPFTQGRPLWTPVAEWPANMEESGYVACAVSEEEIILAKGRHLLYLVKPPQGAFRVVSYLNLEASVLSVLYMNKSVLVRIEAAHDEIKLHKFSICKNELKPDGTIHSTSVPSIHVYGLVAGASSVTIVGEELLSRRLQFTSWDLATGTFKVTPVAEKCSGSSCLQLGGGECGLAIGFRSGRYSFTRSAPLDWCKDSQTVVSVLTQGTQPIAPSVQFTIELWCKISPSMLVGMGTMKLISFSSYASEVQLLVSLTESGTAEIRAGHVLGRGAAATVEVPSSALLDWCHLAFMFRGHMWHLIVNGELLGTSPPCASVPKLNDKSWSAGAGLKGSLLELRVWDTARSVTEIQRDMHMTLTGMEANLAVYLPLTEGKGQVMVDVVSSLRFETPRDVSTAWHKDESVAAVSFDGPVEWITGAPSPVQGSPPKCVVPNIVILPPIEQLQQSAILCRTFGKETKVGVVLPESSFPFSELIRAAKGSCMDASIVLDVSPSGVSWYWGGTLAKGITNVAADNTAIAELPSGSLACIRMCKSDSVISTVIATSGSSPPLCKWPDSSLAAAIMGPEDDPSAAVAAAASMQASLLTDSIPSAKETQGCEVVTTLLSASVKFIDAARTSEGLCFSIPFVTDVAAPTFKQLSEIDSSATPLMLYTYFRLASLHLIMLLRAKVAPSAVGLGGEECCLKPLVKMAEIVLDDPSNLPIIKLAATSFLCSYVPVWIPSVYNKVNYIISSLSATNLSCSRSAMLLGTLKALSKDPSLGAMMRESHLKAFGEGTGSLIMLSFARVLLTALGPGGSFSRPLKKAACSALLQLQSNLTSLAVALHRTVRQHVVPASSPSDPSTPSSSGTSPRGPPPDEGLFCMKTLFFPYMRDLFAAAVVDLRTVVAKPDMKKPPILAHVFPTFVGTLPLLNAYSEEFLKGLSPLLPLFTSASKMSSVLDSEEKLLSGEADKTRSLTVQRVVHAISRQDDAPQTQKVCIPGASSLSLSFDPQWVLNGESLIAHLPGRDPEMEGEPLNMPRGWPDDPVTFAGTDTIIFQFDTSCAKYDIHPPIEKRGFKITVTGQVNIPFPSVHWLHDVVLGLIYTTARVCHALTSSYSVPCTPIDDALVPWITDLSLEADSATEPHEFWMSVIGNTDDGGKLVTMLLRKNLPTAQPHLGGDSINQVLRAIFAALLCHMGFSAGKLHDAVVAGDEAPRPAVRLWRRVEELRHWLLELRQKSRNSRCEDEEKSASGTVRDPVKEVLGRAMVLLRHPPTREITTSLRAAGDAMTNPLMATNTMADLMRSESTTEMRRMSSTWKKAMGGSVVVSRLRWMMRKSRNATLGATPERREAAVLQFCQDERVTASYFDDFVAKRRLLGRRRLSALDCFEKLIFEFTALVSEGEAAPPSLPSANSGLVRAFIKSIKGHHYLDNLACCGREVETAIQTNVYSIVSRLAKRLSSDTVGQGCDIGESSERDIEKVELFLDLMSCAWKGADYGLVLRLDILSTLRQLFDATSTIPPKLAALRAKAWQVLQLLALRAAMEAGPGAEINSNTFAFGDNSLPPEGEKEEVVKSSESPVGDLKKIETTEAESDGESDTGRDGMQVSFLRKVVSVAVEELKSAYDSLVTLKRDNVEVKGKLTKLRSKLDEADHRMRVDKIRCHLLTRHSSGTRNSSSRRNSPSMDILPPKSPVASAAREMRRKLGTSLKRERSMLQSLDLAIAARSDNASAWLAFTTALVTTAPSVLLEIVQELELLKIVVQLLASFDPRHNVEICKNAFSFLRIVMPAISPSVADSTVQSVLGNLFPNESAMDGETTVNFMIGFASKYGVIERHKRQQVVKSYLGFSVQRSTSRLLKILLQQAAWQECIMLVVVNIVKDPTQCWVRRKPDGEPLMSTGPDTTEQGIAKAVDKKSSSRKKNLKKNERRSTYGDTEGEQADSPNVKLTASDSGCDSPSNAEGSEQPKQRKRRRGDGEDTEGQQDEKGDDEGGYSTGTEDVTAESDKETRRKARRIQRRRSRMQRRLERGDSETAETTFSEQRDADGLTRLCKIQHRRLDLALSVLGGGDVRINEGKLATCRLRRGARQHVIVQRLSGPIAIVVPVTAKGSFLASNNIRSKTDALVDVAHNPPREVHTDRLMIGVADMLATAHEVPDTSDVTTSLCGLLVTVLEPVTSLNDVLTHHPPADADTEPLLRLPTLKLSQLKKRIAFSKLLPSILRSLYASMTSLQEKDVTRVLKSHAVLILLKLCSLRIETSDPVPFQHLGEMCALINWVLPHRSYRPLNAIEEEGDDISDRDEFDEGDEEEEENETSRDTLDEPICQDPLQEVQQPWQDGDRDDNELPDIISEYHFATFLEGTDEGMSDDEAWEGYSDANDSDEGDAYDVFKRSEVLRRLCVENDIRREAWKLDAALSFTFAARCVLQLLASSKSTVWEEEDTGPPLLVLKFIAKGSAMAYRGQLDQESVNKGLYTLLRTYSAREELASLLVQEALRLLDVDYTGPQFNSFHLGILFIEAVACSDLSQSVFKMSTIVSLLSHAHTSVGWRRRQVLLLMARLFHAAPYDCLDIQHLETKLGGLLTSYNRQLVPEIESKSGTGDILSMYLQALITLMHAKNCLLPDIKSKPVTDVPPEEAVANGVHNLLTVFSAAAQSFSNGKGLPSCLTENAHQCALPEGWVRYGGPTADFMAVGLGVTLRGVWNDSFEEANVAKSFQSNHSLGSTSSVPWAKRGEHPSVSSGPGPLLLAVACPKAQAESYHNFTTIMGNVAVGCGKWYYEIEIENCSLMQVGWADSKNFTCDSEGGHGVGDDVHSWAYDGMRTCIWHDRKSSPYAMQDGDNKSSRDGDTMRRKKAMERRKRRRQRARRKRRLNQNSSSSQVTPLVQEAQQPGDGWDEGEGDDASTEGEWVDDSAMFSGNEADEADDFFFDDDGLQANTGWKVGDVIGCIIHITADKKADISYSHNGVELGVAFSQVDLSSISGLNPAASLRSGDSAVVNLGAAPFRYCPSGHRGVADSLSWLGNVIRGAYTITDQVPNKAFNDLTMVYSDAWHKAVGHGPLDVSTGNEERKRAQPFEIDEVALIHTVNDKDAPSCLTILSRFNVLARLVLAYVGQEAAMPPVLGNVGTLPGQESSLIGRFMGARDVLFPWAKEPLLDGIIAGACSEGRIASILLSRNYFAQAKGGAGGPTTETLFDQLHALYRSKRPWAFKSHESCDASARLWTVVFEGEAAEDAGGPFRESLTTVCEELMEEAPNSLFISSPNYKGNFGDTRDKWIPRPCSAPSSTEHKLLLSKFRFLGRLIAGCLSINEPMDLSLSSVVWKTLTSTPFDRSDLAAIDQMCLTALDGIVNIDTKGITPELFKDAIDETFVTTLSDGQVIELLPDGRDKEVTFDNREEYARLVIEKRLNEAKEYLLEMREGFIDVLPPAVLDLFTWKVLERRVCGASGISVAELHRGAIYEDIDENSPTVHRFWQALETFTQKDLTNLLRFVAARSRLPVAIKVQPHVVDGNPDDYLPQAHTCFFSIELPEYSSTDVMHDKLQYAIYNCRAIDTDGAPVGLEDMDAEDDEV